MRGDPGVSLHEVLHPSGHEVAVRAPSGPVFIPSLPERPQGSFALIISSINALVSASDVFLPSSRLYSL